MFKRFFFKEYVLLSRGLELLYLYETNTENLDVNPAC